MNLITDVDELINPVTGTWDEELIRDIFWEEDYKLILALPVSEGRENSWLGTMISTGNSVSKVLIGSVGMILSGDVVLVQARVGVDRTLILVGTNSGSFSVQTR